MVAGKNDDWRLCFSEEPFGSVQNGCAQLIVFEGIPGQQNNTRPQRLGGRQHSAKSGRAVTTT